MNGAVDKVTLVQGATVLDYWVADKSKIRLQVASDSGLPADEAPQNVRRISLLNLSKGIGLDRIPGPGGSYRLNTGWDTRWPGRLLLWPQALLVATIDVTDAPPTYNGRQGGVVICNQTDAEDYQVFAQFGDRVVRITSPTAASPTATEVYNHGSALVGIGVGYNTPLTPTGETSVIVGDALGAVTSWQETQDGTTWAAWSPGGLNDDPQNGNAFITVPSSFRLWWIETRTGDWRIQNFTEPNITGSTLVRTIDKAFLRPRFLGIGIDSSDTPTIRYTENTPKRFEGLLSDMGINALSVTSWYKREIYTYKSMLLFTNPAQTSGGVIPYQDRGTLANPNWPGIFGQQYVSAYAMGIALGGDAFSGSVEQFLSLISPHSPVSEVITLDRQQGLPTEYLGFLMGIKARPFDMYMFLEQGTGDFPTADPNGTQITWLMELAADTMSFHPIAKFIGAALWFGLAVVEQYVWALVKTGSTQAKLYRIARGRSPGVVGTDNFEGFVPTAAQFTAANSEFLSIADNTALSMGDIDMSGGTWVYLDSTPASGATMGILGKWSAGNLEYLLQVDNTGGTIRFQFLVRNTADTTTTTVTATTFGTPSTATFYFVQFYHDATANTIGIAVNDGAFNTTSTAGGVRDGTAAFEIGRHTASNYLNGRVDATFLTKRTLTAAEWTYMYNSGNGRGYQNIYAALRTSMVAWWELDETSGTRRDYSGTNTLADNATVTSNPGILSGPIARLEMPWMVLGPYSQSGLMLYIAARGRMTNMNIRVSMITALDGAETVLGVLTASNDEITVPANTTYSQVRLIFEAWRDSGGAATDTLDLFMLDIGVRTFEPPRARYILPIDLNKTAQDRRGAVSHGALLTELRSFINEVVDIVYDEETYNRYILESIIAEEDLKDSAGRAGVYRVVLAEASTPT